MVVLAEPRQVVAPGELLAEGEHLLGENSYKIGNQIYSACVGLLEVDGNRVSVVPLKGGYIPHVGDIVGGRVMDIGLSGWTVDILAPYVAMLPASETEGPRRPRRRDLSEMFDVGDMVMAQVLSFDRTTDPLLTAKGPGLGKVSSGRVIQIQAAKIPRLIGRKGSMISMLKRETGCQISVGQNGIVLVWGRSPEGERVAVEAIYMIEREAHMRGLTDRIREMIAKSPRMEEEVAKQAPCETTGRERPQSRRSEARPAETSETGSRNLRQGQRISLHRARKEQDSSCCLRSSRGPPQTHCPTGSGRDTMPISHGTVFGRREKISCTLSKRTRTLQGN